MIGKQHVCGRLRFRFLTVEGVDVARHQHVGKNEILQDLYPLRGSGFVIVSESFEEIYRRLPPLF